MTRNERAWLNRRLKPHGLRLCAMCNEPCTLDEFHYCNHGYDYCKRCRGILNRVRNACKPRRKMKRHRKPYRERKAEHFERVLASLRLL